MSVVMAGLLSVMMLSSGTAAKPPKGADCNACHEVDLPKFGKSAHGSLDCRDCHTAVKQLPHADKLAKVSCAACHEDAVKAYAGSVHGVLRKEGMEDAATCQSCHGASHEILSSSEAASKTSKRNLADTCGSCHSDPEFLKRHKIPFAKPVEAYRLSVHGRAVARGEAAAASCSDCHGAHDIRAGRDSKAGTTHALVSQTCGRCHSDVQEVYDASVHGQALKKGAKNAPACTDCHGEHSILAPSESGSLVNPARVSTATCGRCHGDERIAERYALPQDKLPSFEDSYHGLALKGGGQSVANCASCHGVHNILSSSDPKSTIHPKNLGQTCGKCHSGAGERFLIGAVHIKPGDAGEHPAVRWIRLAYLVLIPLTIGFMLVHNGLDWLAKLRRGRHGHATGGEVPRMNLKFRVAHGLVVLSFVTLVITGFALKFPDAAWVKAFQEFDPTSQYRGLAHRVAAVVISAATVFHLVHLAVVKHDRVILKELWPRLQDAKDIVAMFRFNLGLSRTRPTFGMFGYAEKMEYWAYMWGTVVMAVTGLILWANTWSLRHLPKWVSDAATAAHWYEAILASLSILVWHWYLVIFDPDVYPMDKAWLTGKTSADHVRETRPEYYQALMARLEAREPEDEAPGEAPDTEEAQAPPTEPGGTA